MSDNNVVDVDFGAKDVHGMLDKSKEYFRNDPEDLIIVVGIDIDNEPAIGFNHDLSKDEHRQKLLYSLARATNLAHQLIDRREEE